MRIKWLDVGKGIGLLFVMLGHLVTYGSPIFNWIFSFHMPLFFFLSGYVSKFETNNSKLHLKKIGITLIVPYFIFVIIGLIISLIIPAWRPISYNDILFDIFFLVQPERLHVGQIWFLFCLAVIQVFFLIFLKLHFKNKLVILVFIFQFALTAYLIHYFNIKLWVNGEHYRLPFKIDTAFMGLFFFSLGYYARLVNFFSKVISSKRIINTLLMLLVLGINIFLGPQLNKTVNMGDNEYGNLIYFIIAALSGILFIIYASKILEHNALLSYMGRNTISIFSSHSFFLFLYTFIISFVFGVPFVHLINIPLTLSFLGMIFIGLLSLLIPIIYNNTIQKLVLKLKKIMLSPE